MSQPNPNGPNKSLDFARQAAIIAHDNRATDVLILDLRGPSPVADFFVIATGTSDRQLRAIADHIDDYAATIGERRYSLCGKETATWILADYIDVVIHLFDPAHRDYYDLELLWGDAPRIDWMSAASA